MNIYEKIDENFKNLENELNEFLKDDLSNSKAEIKKDSQLYFKLKESDIIDGIVDIISNFHKVGIANNFADFDFDIRMYMEDLKNKSFISDYCIDIKNNPNNYYRSKVFNVNDRPKRNPGMTFQYNTSDDSYDKLTNHELKYSVYSIFNGKYSDKYITKTNPIITLSFNHFDTKTDKKFIKII